MSDNGKQTCFSDHLLKMRFWVSDSSNLEQGGVRFFSGLFQITAMVELCLF